MSNRRDNLTIFTKTTTVVAAVLMLAVLSVSSVHAQPIFPSTPAVLFDANSYDAATPSLPNLGTGGSSYDAGTVTVRADNVTGAPTRTANAFGAGLDGITFLPAAGNSGQALGFDATGLSGGQPNVTMFAVVSGDNTLTGTRMGITGYGSATSENGFDNLQMWHRHAGEGDAFGAQIDGSSVDSGFAITNNETTVLAITGDGTNSYRFSIKDSGQDTSSVVGGNAINIDEFHGIIGAVYDGPATLFYNGNIAMMAYVDEAMDDTARDQIVDDLYDRYVNMSGRPLIPEPSCLILMGAGMLGLLGFRGRR